MAPSFRADQVGSLLRPGALLEARKSQDIYLDTALSSEIAEATQAAIAAAVKKQLELSIRPISSGEYERTIFYSGFFEKLEGMTTMKGLPIPDAFRTGNPYSCALLRLGWTVREANIATAPIRHTAPAYLEAWEMLKAVTPRQPWGECKMALPSITFEHIQLASGTAWAPGVYTSDIAYFTDLATAYRAELRALYDVGLRHVQIDEPNLSSFFVDAFLDGCCADGINPDELFDVYRIAEKMFTKLDYDLFYLEYEDQEHQGSFAPLRFLPQGKSVVLGIVSTKTGELEDIDILEARVREAAEVIAKEVLEDALAVSPQCGFASVTEEKMWARLVLLRDLARRVWKYAV
ncbi:hypothetical protein C8R45DRAFT_1063720 [Mycena sanguinolenta]|nr:hypothetical protein C8R45DRAFT_1063720 [Mycena sanguinolenta]